MNSEELELSLRTEFESYLKGVLAGLQQDVAAFQTNFEAEFEKHRAQMDEAFRSLTARFESDIKFDKAFTESVVEHLRLARDDGAQLTAEAFSEAQKLEPLPTGIAYDGLRDAINDITRQTSQAAILKSLVDHVSKFTPRGAFFIVKQDNFVCWRKFDGTGHVDDDAVRSIHFPLRADTLPADAVHSLSTRDSSGTSHADDSTYLDALGFGSPSKMFAVPLVARGRGVAVLYADQDLDGRRVDLEAIESLVRVAGLTVELRAAEVPVAQPVSQGASTYAPVPGADRTAVAEPEVVDHDTSVRESAESRMSDFDVVAEPEPEQIEEYTGEVGLDEAELIEAEAIGAADVEAGYFEPADEPREAAVEYEEDETVEASPSEAVNGFAFASNDTYEASPKVAAIEPEVEADPVGEYAYTAETRNGAVNGSSYEPTPEAVVEVAAIQPTKSRLSDRHVDLPIEVSEDERRFHNDARRFARLLVSEIKLYNEQKVNEGRDVGDLYDRLREAIDRSREMYDKRVQPQVAAKFDYFDYELVSSLAQGNPTKLGPSYPGASV